jgi:deazaflavin-dependent oxidoreductase (nitroreductase family)
VVLTTTGRQSGEPRAVPVSPLDIDGVGYLVSPYGEVGWVKNVRADPRVRLQHGQQDRTVRLMELTPENTARFLLRYWTREKITRPYFEVGTTPTVEDFKADAAAHPVFRIVV